MRRLWGTKDGQFVQSMSGNWCKPGLPDGRLDYQLGRLVFDAEEVAKSGMKMGLVPIKRSTCFDRLAIDRLVAVMS